MNLVDDVEKVHSKNQLILLNTVPRVAAFISACCALYIVITVLQNKYYRSRIYHRIMLGCAINIIIFSGVLLWGSAAAPVGTIYGAAGNDYTCTASGFLLQITILVTPFYFFAFSILSFIAARNKFDYSKMVGTVKWFHIGVYIYPIFTAIYLASTDFFEVNILTNRCDFPCDVAEGKIRSRIPFFLFRVAPLVICILGSITLMIILYFLVRSKCRKEHSIALSVAKQSGLYIFIFIITMILRIVDFVGTLIFGKNIFLITLLANTNEGLIGMWTWIIYLYFRSENPRHENDNKTEGLDDTMTERSSTSTRRRSATMSKPDFSIFDGSAIPDDSPWTAFLTEGEDEEYEEGRVWRQ